MSDLKQRQNLLRKLTLNTKLLAVFEKAKRLLHKGWVRHSAGDEMEGTYCAMSALNVAQGFDHDAEDHRTKPEAMLRKAVRVLNENEPIDVRDWNDGTDKKEVLTVFGHIIKRLRGELPTPIA